MLRTVSLVCFVAATVSAQRFETSDGNLNVNLPVDADLNVVRRDTISVGELAASVASLQSTVADMQVNAAQYHGAQTIVTNVLSQTQTFAASQGTLEGQVSTLESTITALSSRHAEEVSTLRSQMQVLLDEAERNMTQLSRSAVASNTATLGKVSAHAACGENGQVFDFDANRCVTPPAVVIGAAAGEVAPTTCNVSGAVTYDAAAKAIRVCDGTRYIGVTPKVETLPTITHRGWNNDDGRDSGWVSNRLVTFNKEHNSTHIQVDYYDNFRVHGRHSSYANWNVYICNADGSNCLACTDPGPLNLHRYSDTEHGQWVNDHYSGALTGVCRRRGSSNLSAGRYRLQVLIDNNRNDIYTGHHGQYGSFQVSEVFKHAG